MSSPTTLPQLPTYRVTRIRSSKHDNEDDNEDDLDIPRSKRKDGEIQQAETRSEEIQEQLISSLNFDIGATRQLDEHVKESGEKLKAIAEDAKEEMDRAAELAMLRGDLAFDSALADINREADKFERKLRQRRQAMEQESQDMKEWVRDIGGRRNDGQFFGNLYDSYAADGEENDGGLADPEMMMERRRHVIEPAREEIQSPVRMYLFMVLAGMLLVNVFLDIVGDDGPNWGLDGLYGGLALFACWIVVSERKELEQ